MVEAVTSLSSSSSSTLDELSMQHTLIFSDTLKDLKTLRCQLYSAAEYFELAYTKEDEKQIVVNNLKDYAVKALVNTVDHLGSISFKVSGLVDQKFDEIAEANLRVSCIEQRTRVSQAYMDREGLSQQSLVITAPKYHKRYILPVSGDSMPNAVQNAVPNLREMNRIKNKSGEMHQVHNVRPKTKEKQPSFRKLRSIARAPSQRARSSSPAQQHVRSSPPSETRAGDKRSDSPMSSTNPLTRSGSLSRKPSLLKTSSVRVPNPSEPKKLGSLRLHAERNDEKEGEQTPKKSRKFLKSLLSRRKSRKDEPLHSYLDDY